MHQQMFEKINPKVLGSALLFYILIVTLLFTLAPFNYSNPDFSKLDEFWYWELNDTIKNVILFIPIGFLLLPILPDKRKYIYAALFGFGFSSFIEFNQIFIPSRSPGFNDILTNSTGTLLGIGGHFYVKSYVQKKSTTLLHMGIPLMNIVFLLVPLLWISSFAAGYDVNRLWFLLLLGFIGATIITEVYLNRITDKSLKYLVLMLFLLCSWFLISVFPVLVKYPKRLIFFAAILIVYAFIRMKFGSFNKIEKRFELRTLNKIIPVYFIYLVLMSQWPLSFQVSSYHFTWLTDYKMENQYILSIYRYVEYFSAFAVVGYLLSQYINRSSGAFNKTIRLVIWVLLLTIILEFPRGFHTDYSATFENIVVTFAWGVFGAMIYVMQLDYFKYTKGSTEQKPVNKTDS